MYRAAQAPDILRTTDFREPTQKRRIGEGSSEMRRLSRKGRLGSFSIHAALPLLHYDRWRAGGTASAVGKARPVPVHKAIYSAYLCLLGGWRSGGLAGQNTHGHERLAEGAGVGTPAGLFTRVAWGGCLWRRASV